MDSSSTDLQFVLNGRKTMAHAVAPQTTLLDYVRSHGLTGAKESCAEGECGSCAVLLVAETAYGTAYQAVNSCLVPLPAIAGREVYTVEGLTEEGGLSEIQQVMAEQGGSQCGYCTPGFAVSMFAEQYRPPRRPADPHALGGNLCRCTGYRPIGDALASLKPPPNSSLRRRLDEPAPGLRAVSYQAAGSRYSRPCDLREAMRIVSAESAARYVSGNTDLGIYTNLRGERFTHLVSLDGIPELRRFENDERALEIGCGLTLTEIGDRASECPAIFQEWLPLFASPLIRNRATLGGNLATGSPIGDAAPLLLALDAELQIAGMEGERTVPLTAFFQGYRQTVLAKGEVALSVRIPQPFPSVSRFYKAAKRRMDDISTVAACFALYQEADGRIARARVAFGGVGPVPLRVPAAEAALVSGDLNGAKSSLRLALHPISDHRGSAAYRLALALNLLEKFWLEHACR